MPDTDTELSADLRDALDALESMVVQYLDGDTEHGFDHQFMTAGEQACEVLARLRPGRWELTSTGMVPGERFDEQCPGSGTVPAPSDGIEERHPTCPYCERQIPTHREGFYGPIVFMGHPAEGSWATWRRAR